MPELPGYGVVPSPSLRPNTDVPTVPRLRGGDVGDAFARLGDTAEKAIGAQVDAQQQLQYATARSTFLAQKTAIQVGFDNDQDWATMPDRYRKQVGDSMTQIAGTIQNPMLRQRFMIESAPDMAGGLGEVQLRANAVRRDQTRGNLLTTLDTNRASALAAGPLQAPAIVRATTDAITAARNSNAITATEAAEMQQKWVADYGKGYLETLPPAQRLRLLTGSATPPNEQPMSSGRTGPLPRAEDVAPLLQKVMPGLVITGMGRTPAQNAAVGGVSDSDHLQDHALDIRPLPGMTFQQFRDKVIASGAVPAGAQIIDETKPGTPHSTGPHWHVGWHNAGAPPASDVAGPPSGMTIVPKTGTPADFVPLDVRAEMARQAAAQVREDGALGRAQAVQGLNDDVTWLRSGGDPAKVTSTPEGVRASIGGPEGDEAAAALADAQRYGADVRRLQMAPQSEIDGIIAGHMPTGPAGFRAAAQDMADLQRIAAERNAALKADAAGYVVQVEPGVQSAYQAYVGSTDPKAQAVAFDTYVHKLNAAYTTLGLPSDQRPIIPLADAKNVISRIENSSPTDAAQLIDALKGTAGRWWLPVYGALARAGLPAWVQAVSVASPQDQPTMIAALQHSGDKGFKAYTDLVPHDQITGTAGSLSPLDQALADDEGLNNLRASMVAYGRGGAAIYEGTQRAVRTTALYLMATQHMTAQQAATRAASMVTGPFDFMVQDGGPPARLPKGTLDAVTAAASARLAALKPGDVEPYRQLGGEEGGVVDSTAADRAAGALAGAQRAWWMTITGPDGAPRLRAIDPQTNMPVMLRGHVPLDIPVGSTPAPASTTIPGSSAMVPGKAAYHVDSAIWKGEHATGMPHAR